MDERDWRWSYPGDELDGGDGGVADDSAAKRWLMWEEELALSNVLQQRDRARARRR